MQCTGWVARTMGRSSPSVSLITSGDLSACSRPRLRSIMGSEKPSASCSGAAAAGTTAVREPRRNWWRGETWSAERSGARTPHGVEVG